MSVLEKKIKLIWDFRGPAALKIAEHHEIHLKEFIVMENVDVITTGFTSISDMHSIAYMVVNQSNMIAMRDRLKPHRGEIYVEE